MKKILTHENRMIVYNLKNVLQAEGIETRVVNEFAAGGAGDLATFDTWPELWLEDESREVEAHQLISTILNHTDDRDWFCRHCQEKNAASFQICWNCGTSAE
ncbi:MAG: DUF2007 domain-containing protein [Pseudomonadota bacterium]